MPSPENKGKRRCRILRRTVFAGLDVGNFRPIFAPEAGSPNESAF
jgi:hypothetical protein